MSGIDFNDKDNVDKAGKLFLKYLENVNSDIEENKSIREKYLTESNQDVKEIFVRLDLHLKIPIALKVLELLKENA